MSCYTSADGRVVCDECATLLSKSGHKELIDKLPFHLPDCKLGQQDQVKECEPTNADAFTLYLHKILNLAHVVQHKYLEQEMRYGEEKYCNPTKLGDQAWGITHAVLKQLAWPHPQHFSITISQVALIEKILERSILSNAYRAINVDREAYRDKEAAYLVEIADRVDDERVGIQEALAIQLRVGPSNHSAVRLLEQVEYAKKSLARAAPQLKEAWAKEVGFAEAQLQAELEANAPTDPSITQ